METKNNGGMGGEVKNGGRAIKTVAAFVIIIFTGTTVLFFLNGLGKINLPVLDSFTQTAQEKQQAQTVKYFSDLQEKNKNDTYGGDTPEQTMQMFIAALKAGDTDLAAKYFVVEKQEEMTQQLATGRQKDTLKLLISDVERSLKNGKELFAGSYQFETFDENKVAEFSFDLSLNKFTNKWKIESL